MSRHVCHRTQSYRPRIETLERRFLPSTAWTSFAHDPQHTALSAVASQSLDAIHWSTPVDTFTGDSGFSHYGSPLVTADNVVISPFTTKLGGGGFEMTAHQGSDGTALWTLKTDYVLPPHGWILPFQAAVSPAGLVYAGDAGSIILAPLTTNPPVPKRVAFYGISNYFHDHAALKSTVFIDTPITADAAGNVYFGFEVTGPNPLNLQSGIARISATGHGTWVAAATAANDQSIIKVVDNCAPALSNDGKTLYITVSTGDGGDGYLLALDSGTLATRARVFLLDPSSNSASLPDSSTASPLVGPDGDVYIGVLENPFPYNNDRGWMLHFNGTLSTEKTIGAFGWDDTASVVPASMVPSYHGKSSYLLLTKYNNYAGIGGDGHNKVAILDPNATEVDLVTGHLVMNEVMTLLGPTPDPTFDQQFPGAVYEWCINSAAVDPATKSVIVNSEDGHVYRWDMTTGTITQTMALNGPSPEPYTETVIGVDGTVYAMSNGILYAIGQAGTAAANRSGPAAAFAHTGTSNPAIDNHPSPSIASKSVPVSDPHEAVSAGIIEGRPWGPAAIANRPAPVIPARIGADPWIAAALDRIFLPDALVG
jgi:hypothetical protein